MLGACAGAGVEVCCDVAMAVCWHCGMCKEVRYHVLVLSQWHAGISTCCMKKCRYVVMLLL